jgi:hypothetical protein
MKAKKRLMLEYINPSPKPAPRFDASAFVTAPARPHTHGEPPLPTHGERPKYPYEPRPDGWGINE